MEFGYLNHDRKSIVFKILVNSSIVGAALGRKEPEFLMHRLTKQILARLKRYDIRAQENIVKDPKRVVH
jgi:hypothetical protein